MKILEMIKNIAGKIIRHKIVSFIIAAIAIAGGTFAFNALGGASQIRYVLAAAEKGNIITTVSGSGQVSASKQVDIKATVSGDVISVNAKVGDEVTKGQIIARLDSTSAQKSVRDAETNLESAQLALEKILKPAEDLDILKAENSLEQAKQAEIQAEENLEKSYQDSVAALETIFIGLPNIMVRLHDLIIGTSIFTDNINYYVNAAKKYDSAISQYGSRVSSSYENSSEEYQEIFNKYLKISRSSDRQDIENLVEEAVVAARDISETTKNAADLISHSYNVIPATQGKTVSDSNLASLNSDAATIKTYLTSITSAKNSIQSCKQALINAELSIAEKEKTLEDLKAGPDELELRSQQISISQKEEALAEAKDKLNDYTIIAPFDGVIAAMEVSQGDSIASISSYGTIATIITKSRVAEISLNEVDASKVEVGQKASLVFDAIDDLAIVGEVSEVDTIGTVSQGVVSYNVKILFDAEENRVKPGMSVSASIITEADQNLLLVPSSAIQGTEGYYYVETLSAENILSGQNATGSEGVFSLSDPIQKSVEVGLSDDTMVEIIRGIEEKELVVVKTIIQTVQSGSSSQGQGLFSFPGSRNSSKSSNGNSGAKGNSSSGGSIPSGGNFPAGGMGPGM
ncbi:MAG: efflux RND transporter periplasmic adaptor subunit [Candidatus Pacebacteria bacterium]|nr:efflux RND transporter periplasmic adaptor subunit [Candidatus Paceibacterota bacterium]MDD4874784.1 efflux RND transporter periplasmic adaptor subunit [Candidatus Paceibacterota bacterium]